MTTDFTYDNRTGRGPGRVVRALGRVLPGVRAVQEQVEPYADAWRVRNLAALRTPGPRWYVLGDSMSQGVGASTPERGWVDQLLGRLIDEHDEHDGHDEPDACEPLTVVNLSATGARTPDLLAQQVPVLDALGPSAADLVTVLVGSNDLFAGRAHRNALPSWFAHLAEALPDGAVVATLPQPRRAASEANRHLESAAEAGHLRLVDLRTAGPTSWRGRLAADRFHPNDAGYAAIADAFEPVVRAALVGGRA